MPPGHPCGGLAAARWLLLSSAVATVQGAATTTAYGQHVLSIKCRKLNVQEQQKKKS